MKARRMARNAVREPMIHMPNVTYRSMLAEASLESNKKNTYSRIEKTT